MIEWFEDEDKCFAFGKYRGRLLSEILQEDPAYLRWMMEEMDLPLGIYDLIEDLLSEPEIG
jgi:uncharacterized protein (DUF3820 family)